jgi:hypothetical protein
MKKYGLLIFFCIHIISILHINIKSISVFHKTPDLSPLSVRITQGCLRVTQSLGNWVGICLEGYATWTGLTGYVFFSPNPPVTSRLIIERENEAHQICISHLEATSFELENKFVSAHSFISSLNQDATQDSLRTLCAQSIAARLFEKYPDAIRINVISPNYRLPCMKDFRQGQQTAFKEHSQYEFQKNN